MEVLDVILSTQFLAGIVMIGALALSIRSAMHFSHQAARLRPRLNELEVQIRKIRSGTEDQRKAVEELTKVVQPVQAEEARVRAYYEQLQEISIEYEKSEQARSEKEEANRRRRIQRKKMGYEDGV